MSDLKEDFPPRGSGIRGRLERLPNAEWVNGATLDDLWTHRRGKLLLGHDGDGKIMGRRRLGFYDNRHIITIAGSRAGKTKSLVIPNVLDYPGSMVVIDPKGEIAEATWRAREKAGHRVIILNPFPNETQGLPPSNSYNPFDELRQSPEDSLPANAAQIADALIMVGQIKDPHWPNSAKNLLLGAILFGMAGQDQYANMRGMRSLISDNEALIRSWRAMAQSDLFEGRLRNIGNTFLGKLSSDASDSNFGSGADELRSIQSVALEQTRALDDVAAISDHSDFSISDFAERPTTLYLVLPGTRLSTHARWLRLIIYQLLAEFERKRLKVDPGKGQWPLRLVLEEFAVLGSMEAIEAAAGYIAGFGIQMWVILQDLTQIQRHYKDSWETFLGNAGIINAFNVVDVTTTRYLSNLIGKRSIIERRNVRTSSSTLHQGNPGYEEHPHLTPLLEPAEITFHFARETNRQLIIIPGMHPIYMQRLPYE